MKLIRGIDSDRARQEIVRSLIALCRTLSIGIIAEGVETADEYRWLFEAGVALFQGYYFARPAYESLPVIDFADYRLKPGLYALVERHEGAKSDEGPRPLSDERRSGARAASDL